MKDLDPSAVAAIIEDALLTAGYNADVVTDSGVRVIVRHPEADGGTVSIEVARRLPAELLQQD